MLEPALGQLIRPEAKQKHVSGLQVAAIPLASFTRRMMPKLYLSTIPPAVAKNKVVYLFGTRRTLLHVRIVTMSMVPSAKRPTVLVKGLAASRPQTIPMSCSVVRGRVRLHVIMKFDKVPLGSYY